MKRFLKLILPIAWTLLFFVPAAYIAAYVIMSVYEVPLETASFRFERQSAVWLLLGPVLVLAAHYVHASNRPRLLVSRGRTLKSIKPGWRSWTDGWRAGVRAAALALVAIGLMGPQSIHARDDTTVEGIDIVLALDMSLSMQAADVQPNRFDATKQVVLDFISRRPNDRIGSVVFGRDAFTLMPLTTDKEALRTVINELQLEQIDGRGTAIGNAVGTSLNRLRRSDAESKVVILLTDGDSNAGNISPDQAAELASAMEVQVFSILMGQTEDSRVQRGTDLFGRPIFDSGNFPVNPELLQRMSERTGARFFSVTDRQSLERSFHDILNELERTEMEDRGQVFGELFPAFVGPAILLLFIELLLGAFVLRRWP